MRSCTLETAQGFGSGSLGRNHHYGGSALTGTKLILFDIDGTLIDPGGAGRMSMTRAFKELYSIPDAFSGIRLAGKTDLRIIKEGLALHGILQRDVDLHSMMSLYVRYLKEEIQNKNKRLMPGVTYLLETLASMKGYNLGLLTGNVEAGARIKLEPFNLNRFFSFGAFGNEHEDRNQLLPLAVKKFRELARVDVDFSACTVVGDTPSDVQCAKTYGASSIAVATGPYSYGELLETGADVVLNDLNGALYYVLGE
jgi:phosphoglycolate phosphatase-like HAD superfamily hydrolase